MSNRAENNSSVRVLMPHNSETAHYNAAVIGKLFIIREVLLNEVKPGLPDPTKLNIYRSTIGKPEKIGQLNLSDPSISNWEDARAFSSKKSKKVLIGLTAIRTPDNEPVAATVEGNIVDNNFLVDPKSLTVYPNDIGKNVTPISLNHSLFRRNGFGHSLEIVETNKKENGNDNLKVKKIIEFPKKPWCEWQIGTQAQVLPGGILPIHGVNRFNLGTEPEIQNEVFGYSYSLGLAQLDRDLNVIKMSNDPLFTRQSFKNILPMGKELDTNKDVIYCCGYSITGGTVKFIINIGDLMTVEVTKTLSELKRALDL